MRHRLWMDVGCWVVRLKRETDFLFFKGDKGTDGSMN